MRGKGWLAATIGVGLLAVWRLSEHDRRVDGARSSEAELAGTRAAIPTVRDRLERPDAALDAAPDLRQVEARVPENLTAPSGSSGRIHGHARDQDGRPLASYQVWLVERKKTDSVDEQRSNLGEDDEPDVLERTRTDVDGSYELANVGPGDWRIGIPELSPPGSPRTSFYPMTVVVEMQPGDSDREVDLVVYRGITIQGTVTTPDGKPALGAVVLATASADGPELARAPVDDADAEGRFELGPLSPGRFLVQAKFPRKFLPSVPASVMAGAQDVHLELTWGGHLVVTLVDPMGQRALVESLSVHREGSVDGEPVDPYEPREWQSRELELEGLHAGVYDLVARSRSEGIGLVRGVRVEEDGRPQGVTIHVEPWARLEIACSDRRKVFEVELDSDDVLVESTIVTAGNSRWVVVPPGRIRVRFEPAVHGLEPAHPGGIVEQRKRQVWKSFEIFAVAGDRRTVEIGKD